MHGAVSHDAVTVPIIVQTISFGSVREYQTGFIDIEQFGFASIANITVTIGISQFTVIFTCIDISFGNRSNRTVIEYKTAIV